MTQKSKLFIHIGTHKTGSTAIQSALADHQDALHKEGIVFVRSVPDGIRSLVKAKELNPELIDKCRDEIEKRYPASSNVDKNIYLMSWEGLSGTAERGYQDAPVIASNLRKVTENFDVTIIVYLRRQDDFLESMYTQMIHQGEVLSFDEYVSQYDLSAFNWQNLVQAYSECFGENRIIVRRFSKEALPNENSLLKDFAQIIGSTVLSEHISAKKDQGQKQNQGYSRDALEIARLSIPHLDVSSNKQLRKLLQNNSSKKPFDQYSFWSYDQRMFLYNLHRSSNSSIAREYFVDETKELFMPPELEADSERYQGLTHEAVTVFTVKALLEMQATISDQNESRILRLITRVERMLFDLIKGLLK